MIEILITSSVLILVLLALRRLLRGRLSFRLQYALWLLVALRLLIPGSLFSSPVSVMTGVEAIRAQGAELWGEGTSPAAPDGETGGQAAPIQPSDPQGTANSPSQGTAPQGSPAQSGGSPASQPSAQPAEPALSWSALLRWVWYGGMGAMAVWFLLSNWRFRRRLLAGAERLEGVDCPLPVYLSPEASSPCLCGLLRPAIYVTPACLEKGRNLDHVLAHELTHHRHGDQFWSLVRCLCLTVYWFHPLVWAAAVCSRRDCELACDEGALRRLGEGERIPYGRTLVGVVAQSRQPGALLHTATSMGGGARTLLERVNFIARGHRATALTVVCALLIAALTAGCVFTGAPAADGSPSPDPSAGPSPAVTQEGEDPAPTQPSGAVEPEAAVDPEAALDAVRAAVDGGESLEDFPVYQLAAAFSLSDGAYTEAIVHQLARSFPQVLEVGYPYFSYDLAAALLEEIYSQGGQVQADFEAALPAARHSSDTDVARSYFNLEVAWTISLGDFTAVHETAALLQSAFTPIGNTPETSYGLTGARLTVYGDGPTLAGVTEWEDLGALSALLRNAESLGWVPKTFSFVATLHLTLPDGSPATLDLDAEGDLCRLTVPSLAPFGIYLDYGPGFVGDGSINALPDLLGLLGLSDWPAEVKEAWPVYYGYEVLRAIDQGTSLTQFSAARLAGAFSLSDGAYTEAIVHQLALSFPALLAVDPGILDASSWQALWQYVVTELHTLGSPYPQLLEASLGQGQYPQIQRDCLQAAEAAWQEASGGDATAALYQAVEAGYAHLLTGEGDLLALHILDIGQESMGAYTSFYTWVYLWVWTPGGQDYQVTATRSEPVVVTLEQTEAGWAPAPHYPFETLPQGTALEDFFPPDLLYADFSTYNYDALLSAKAQAAALAAEWG